MKFVDILKCEINYGKIESFVLTQKTKYEILINIFKINKMKETVKKYFSKMLYGKVVMPI